MRSEDLELICDRCGRRTSDVEEEGSFVSFDMSSEEFGNRHFDLCPGCYMDMKDWLEAVR